MKLPLPGWRNVLRTLGYKANFRRRRVDTFQPFRHERLEPRRLLAGDNGIVTQASLDQILATVANPLVVRLADFNADVHQDAAIVSASGQVTIALNGGDGTWSTRQTTNLTNSQVLGMEVSLVNGDDAPDLVLQTADHILVATNNGRGNFTISQTLSPFPPGEMARPMLAAPARMVISDLDGDLNADLAFAAPVSNQIAVYFGNGEGTFGIPEIEYSGGAEPLVLVAGNYSGNALPDIVVGHADGSLRILENAGHRSFNLRMDLSRQLNGAVVDLATSDLEGDGDLDIVAATGNTLQVLKNERSELAVGPVISNSGFESGLAGWDIDVRGHRTASAAGSVLATGGRIQLVENGSFLVTVSKDFLVPAQPGYLEIDLASIGLEPSAGGIPDAFEISLLDASGQSLVPAIRNEATSFFNANPGGQIEWASGTTFNGRTVTVNLAGVPAGTAATLFLDLVGNGGGTGSTVTVEGVRISPESYFDSSFEAISLAGSWTQISQVQIDDVDGDGRQDIALLDRGTGKLFVLNGRAGLQFDEDEIEFPSGTTGLISMDASPLTAGDQTSDLVVLAAGSQQLFSSLISDTSVPTAELRSPVPDSTNTGSVSRVEIRFNETMRAISSGDAQSVTHAGNFAVRFFGVDDIPGTGDDQVLSIVSARYNPLTSTVTLAIDPASTPLADGVYRVELDASRLRDASDNPLAGGANVAFQFTMNTIGPEIAPIPALQSREGDVVTVMTTFADSGGQVPYSATIDWGDGSVTDMNMLDFSNGHATLAATHIYPDNGIYQVSVTVRDAADAATQSFTTVTVSNVLPALVPATATIDAIRNQPVNRVLASFTDPGFNNLNTGTFETFEATIDWGDGVISAGTVQWASGIPGTPTSGTISGQHTWSQAGSYTVTISLTDDDGGQAVASVQVNVENDAPVVSVNTVAGVEGGSVSLAATFSDVGNAGLYSAMIDWGDGRSSPGAVTIVDGNGSVSGSHIYADNGLRIVTVSVTDPDGNTGQGTASAHIANSPPVIDSLADQLVNFGQTVELAVRFIDAGFSTTSSSETFLASIAWGDGTSEHNLPITVQPGAEGLASVGTFSVEHNYPWIGSFTAVVTVRDDDGDEATRSLNILVQNVEPVIEPLQPVVGVEGNSVSIEAAFSDVRPNQSYVATVDWGDGNSGPATVTFAGGSGTLSGQHIYADNGNYTITLMLADSSSQSVSVTTSSTIANLAPQIVLPDDVSLDLGAPLVLSNIPFSDPGFSSSDTSESFTGLIDWGDGTTSPATLDVVNGGEGIPTTGTLSGSRTYAAEGVYPVTLTITDDDGDSATVVFHVSVIDPDGGGKTGGTRFFVVDKTADRVFRYNQSGNGVGHFATTGSKNARGVTTWISGDPLWIIDQDRNVYVYDTDGDSLAGFWKAGSISNPEGIATDGVNIWIVDQSSRRVYFFPGAASLRNGSMNPASSFQLSTGNRNPSDITTDGERFWVVDHTDDRVYMYSLNGTFEGAWNLDPANRNATGIAISPSGATGIWVVDKVDNRVYAYPTAFPGGHSQTASGWFPLDPNNRNPEGIADPVDPYTIGTVASGTTTALNEVREFAFTANAGQFLFFDALTTNASRYHWSVRNPDGTTLFAYPSSMPHHDRTQLTQTGTFLLSVTSRVSFSSTFLFQVNDVTDTNPVAIAVDQSVSGNIAVAGSIREFLFAGTAGQPIYFDALSTSQSQFNWRALNPDGSLLFSDTLMRDRDTTVLPAHGTYTLVVDGTSNRTGAFAFRLREVPPVTSTPINFGEVVGEMMVPGQIREYTFTASAGMDVFLDMQSLAGATGSFTSSLVSPSGAIFHSRSANNADAHDSGTRTLNETGTWTVRIKSFDEANFSLAVWQVPPPGVHAIQFRELAHGITGVPGEKDEWRWQASAGQIMYIDFLSTNVRIDYVLRAPDGTQLVFKSNSLERVLDHYFVAGQSGTYTLIAKAQGDSSDLLNYTFQVWDVPANVPQPMLLNQTIQGEIVPGQIATFSLPATSGSEVLLDIMENSNGALGISLVGPDGTTLINRVTTDRLVTLPQSGLYQVVVRRSLDTAGNEDNKGPYRFRLQETASPEIGGLDTRGTRFYVAFARQYRASGSQTPPDMFITLTSDVNTSGTIQIPGLNWFASYEVSAGVATTIQLPDDAEMLDSDVVTNEGVLITSLDEVAVYGLSQKQFSTDGFTAIPVDALGNEYVVLGYKNTLSSVFPGGTNFTIVATADDTSVSITPTLAINARPANVPYTISLNKGQSYHVWVSGPLEADLTGTRIVSTRPVSVFGGNTVARVPTGVDAADHLVEQLPSTNTWGSQFLAHPLATRTGGDTFRILARQDNTRVFLNGTLITTLAAWQYHEQIIDGASSITSSEPVLVAQYSNGSLFDNTVSDPFMKLVVPVQQYQNSYILSTPQSGIDNNYANLIVPDAVIGTVRVDGNPLGAGVFAPIGTTGYSSASIPLSIGSHEFSAASSFGVTVYGFDDFDSYGYIGGMTFAPLNAVSTLSLNNNSTAAVASQQAVAAFVRDANGFGIRGVRVDFQVSGANPGIYHAFTNSQGVATIQYVGHNAGFDTVNASAAGLSAASTIEWISAVPAIEVFSPVPGSSLLTGKWLLTGRARTPLAGISIVEVLVNGKRAESLDAGGHFFASFELVPGSNSLVIAATDSRGQSTTTTVELSGVVSTFDGAGNSTGTDLAESAALEFSRTTFNRLTRELLVETRLANRGHEPLKSTVVARIESIDPIDVRLANPDATSADEKALILFDSELPGVGLGHGQSSLPVLLRFENPNDVRFAPEIRILAESNRAPRIVSAPVSEALPEREWNYQVLADDPDGHSLAWALVTGPQTMAIDVITGMMSWSPALSDSGRHDVVVSVDDGKGGRSTQSFTLSVSSVSNRPPVFVSAPVVTSPSGSDYEYQAEARDADGDPLIYSLTQAPSGMEVDPANGLVTWSQPAAGNYSVVLTVSDSRGGVADQIFNLRVGPGTSVAVPSILSIPVAVAAVGDFYAYTPEVLDTSGTALVFSLIHAPAGMSIDPDNGRITWVAAAGQEGNASVTWQTANGEGGSAVQSYNIEVLVSHPNAAPHFTTQPVRTGTAGELWSYGAFAVDPDENTLTYELVVAPAGMTIDSLAGNVAWTPGVHQTGEHRVLISASDTSGLKAWQHFYLSVRSVNSPPVFVSVPVTTLVAGTSYVYQAIADDREDQVGFSLISGPSGMTINPTSGLISWTPHQILPGDYPVVIRAMDERGMFAEQGYTLTIQPDNDAPEIAFGSRTVVDIGEQVLIKVRATDNVRVTSLTLYANGIPVTLVDGQATIEAAQAGLVTLTAVATDDSGNIATAERRIRVIDPDDSTAPFVEITSPAMLAPISYLTGITGTILASDIESWRLEYGLMGMESWTTLADGTSEANNQLLATFDPTLLANDVYEVRLVAWDFSGNIAEQRIHVLLEGQAKIGNFAVEYTDLSIPLAGIPITVGRRYDTLQAGHSGDFGFGWSLTFGQARIRETVPVSALEAAGVPALFGGSAGLHIGSRVFLTTPEGQRVGFTFDPVARGGLLGTVWHPRFRADVDTDYELEVDPVALQQGVDGRFQLYLLGGNYNPRGYTLVGKNQMRYRYDQFDDLQSVSDRNGVSLDYREDGIFSNTGASITWQRDSQGRITSVTDPDGNITSYTYSASGDLIAVTDPVNNVTTLSYLDSPVHYLDKVIGPRGNLVSEVQYDAAGRFVAVLDAEGNTARQDYDLSARTFVQTDRLGNATTFVYNDRGYVTRVTDPLGRSVQAEYGDPRHPHLETAVTDARGNTSYFTYDSRGNMTVATRPDGSFTRVEYDSFRNITRTIGPLMIDPGDGFADSLLDSYFADEEVTGFTTGEMLDGETEPRVFPSADVILGPEFDRETETERDSEFILLARPGDYVTVGFDEVVEDHHGDDIFVITPMFGGGFPDSGQRAQVSVTVDGTTFIPLGIVGVEAYAGLDLAASNITGPILGIRVTALFTDDGNAGNDYFPLTGIQVALGDHPTTRSVYDERGNLLSFTNAEGDSESFTYDLQGRILTSTDADGNTTEMEYGAFADPDLFRFADGNERVVERNGKGLILTSTSELGQQSSFQYDRSGRPLAVTDALGKTWTNQYDADLLIKTTDPLNRETAFEYDSRSRLIRVIDAMGGITSRTLDANNRVVAVTNALGQTETWEYDAVGQLESHSDTAGQVTEFEYDENSNLTLVRNARGAQTEYTWNSLDLLISRTDALGQVVSFGYDLRENLIRIDDARGGVTRFEYDAVGRLLKSTDPLGGIESWVYDHHGNVVSYTDPLGNTTSTEYDLRHRQIRETDAAGFSREWEYDAASRMIRFTDQAGEVTHYAYDANNMLLSVTDALGGITAFAFDDVGNRISVTDPLGRVSRTLYDDLDRAIATIDADNGTTEFDYDAIGNLLSVSDPLGNVTSYQYNDRNQVERRIDPLGNAAHFEYDEVGNLTRSIDRLGRITEFSHDLLDRLTGEVWRETGGGVVETIVYAYDASDNLLSASSDESAGSWQYDLLDRVLVSNNAGTIGPQISFEYEWDAAGNRTKVRDSFDVQVEADFDSRHLLRGLQWSGGGIDPARVDFSYDGRGQLAGISRFADLAGTVLTGTTAQSFDALGRIRESSHFSGTSSLVANYDFDFDAASQMVGQIVNGQASSYVYDELGQLTNADNATRPDEAYTYDANGNRIDGNNLIGPNNRLLSDGEFDFVYDLEGNLVRKTEIATGKYTVYEFDHRNRMTGATTFSAGGIILAGSSYTYDLFDRMIRRTVDADGAGPNAPVTTWTVYDGENAWADFDGAGNVIARYLFGEAVDSNIARWRPGEGTAWYLTDHLGSIRDIVDSAGNVIDHIEYDSFGNILSESNAAAGDRFKFTGREWMSELGLYYYRARFYDALNGRFISEDPIGFAGGDANLNRYVGNSPLTFVDPTGLTSVVATAAAIQLDLRLASAINTGSLSFACGFLSAHFAGHENPEYYGAAQAVLGYALGYALHGSAAVRRVALFASVGMTVSYIGQVARGEVSGTQLVVDTACFAISTVVGTAVANKFRPASPAARASFGNLADDAVNLQLAAGSSRITRNAAISLASTATEASTRFSNLRTAARFLKDGRYFDGTELRSLTRNQRREVISGIDLTHPVNVRTFDKGTELIQYVREGGRPGPWFTTPGTSASEIGLYSGGRQLTNFKTTLPIQVLESTARPVIDTWSVRGFSVPTSGGGTQFYTFQGYKVWPQ